MHRHGYKGRKFGRQRDQREALLRGLADSLVLHESIETTQPKAKELIRYTEKLITKAKKGDLHERRQIIAKLNTAEAAHKLIDELAPKLVSRTSGHLKFEKTRLRRGDNVQLAKVSFIKDPDAKKPTAEEQPKDDKEKETASKAKVSTES